MEYTVKIWLILLISSCVQLYGQEVVNLESITTTSTTTPEKINKSTAQAVNNFGYKLLLKMMNEKKNDNIIISPTGISALLAMILLGSVGRTYDEIAATLGFSQDIFTNRKNHEQLGELLESLNNNSSSKTLYADAIFLDLQTPLRDLYNSYVRDVYRCEVLGADFKQAETAKNQINDWVKNHTEGQIENFLKFTLPTSTKLVLLNALYFRGQWKHPFSPEYTTKMSFNTETGEVNADLMLNFGEFPYRLSKKHDFVIIALPYNDTETVMYVLKPLSPKTKLLELMERLDNDIIDEAINEMSHKRCVIRFPKLELKSNVNLENTLKSIGIRELFIPGEANLALMVDLNNIVNKTEEELITRIESRNNFSNEEETRSAKSILDSLPNPGLHVDSIIHDVKITIDEYGTEAVAATAAVLARTAELFYANSPYYIFIRNNKTKLVTFSAVIFNPTL